MDKKIKRDLSLESLQEIAEGLLLRDGYLVPVIFLCGKEGTDMIEIEGEMMENDETKDYMVETLSTRAKDKEIHRVLFVSECWMYRAPAEMTEEQIEEVARLGKYRHQLEREESYQVIEITRDSTRMVTQAFIRNDDDPVKLDGQCIYSDAELIRFKPLQEVLKRLD